MRAIQRDVNDRSYEFGGYRGALLPKRDHAEFDDPKAWRPISMPSIRDRVLQRAILNVIWVDVRRYVHTPSSYGGVRQYRLYRKQSKSSNDRIGDDGKKNVRSAAKQIVKLRQRGYPWLFESDIENFFPSVDKSRLLTRLFGCLRDDSLNELIAKALDTSITNPTALGPLASLWNPEVGVPQGGILSPMFANLYLYDFDKSMREAGFRLIRYVDDFVVLCKTEADAQTAYRLAQDVLQNLGLKIHELKSESNGRIKTNIHPPGAPFEFLGLHFTNHTIKPTQQKTETLRQRIEVLTDIEKSPRLSLFELVKRLNARLLSWLRSYDFCNITTGELDQLDRMVKRYVTRWLKYRRIIKSEDQLSENSYRHIGVYSPKSFLSVPLLGGASGKSSLAVNPDC